MVTIAYLTFKTEHITVCSGRVLLNTNPMQESDTEKFRKRKIANKNLFMQRAVIFFSRGDFGESVAKGKQTIF
jgi:hypothetical protein